MKKTLLICVLSFSGLTCFSQVNESKESPFKGQKSITTSSSSQSKSEMTEEQSRLHSKRVIKDPAIIEQRKKAQSEKSKKK